MFSLVFCAVQTAKLSKITVNLHFSFALITNLDAVLENATVVAKDAKIQSRTTERQGKEKILMLISVSD